VLLVLIGSQTDSRSSAKGCTGLEGILFSRYMAWGCPSLIRRPSKLQNLSLFKYFSKIVSIFGYHDKKQGREQCSSLQKSE